MYAKRVSMWSKMQWEPLPIQNRSRAKERKGNVRNAPKVVDGGKKDACESRLARRAVNGSMDARALGRHLGSAAMQPQTTTGMSSGMTMANYSVDFGKQ
jgi:hypothetical protein